MSVIIDQGYQAEINRLNKKTETIRPRKESKVLPEQELGDRLKEIEVQYSRIADEIERLQERGVKTDFQIEQLYQSLQRDFSGKIDDLTTRLRTPIPETSVAMIHKNMVTEMVALERQMADRLANLHEEGVALEKKKSEIQSSVFREIKNSEDPATIEDRGLIAEDARALSAEEKTTSSLLAAETSGQEKEKNDPPDSVKHDQEIEVGSNRAEPSLDAGPVLESVNEDDLSSGLKQLEAAFRESLKITKKEAPLTPEEVKKKNFIADQDLHSFSYSRGKDRGWNMVATDKVVGTVSGSFDSWASEYEGRRGLVDAIANGLIQDARKKPSASEEEERAPELSFQKAFASDRLPIRFNMIEGPVGPVFIVADGSHRIAASKRAELPKVMGRVSEIMVTRDQATRDAVKARQWKKYIDRGLMSGVVTEQDGTFKLEIKQQLVPWVFAGDATFIAMNQTYERAYPEGFKNIRSLQDGQPIPSDVFTDQIALNWYLTQPEGLAAYLKSKKES